jgi:hypothetical protein
MQSIKEREREIHSIDNQERDLRENLKGRERRCLVEGFWRSVEVSHLRSDFV